LVVIGFAVIIFFLRGPIRNRLDQTGGGSTKFMWVSFGLNIVLLMIVMAACISAVWSMTTGLHVGLWKACTSGGDCADTLKLTSDGKGNIHATRFFILTSVFPCFALLAFPFLYKYNKISEPAASSLSFYSLLYVGVASFISMCVWASYQYDVLAKYSTFGTWKPGYALGLSCIAWMFAFSSAIVCYIWKLKAHGGGGGGDLAQTKTKEQPSYPTPMQTNTAPPSHGPPPAYSAPAPLANYPTPQPLQQYGQPGVDV